MTTEPGRLDALLPPEMARRAENVGVAKAGMDAPRLFVLALLAGAFIALGAAYATEVLAGHSPATGAVRVLAGTVFSLGLILVIVGGAELFTGNALIVMAWASRRVSTRAVFRNWAIVYAGNALGAIATAAAVHAGRTITAPAGSFGEATVRIAMAKLQLGWMQAVVLGVLCNALVCLAVWLSLSARTTTDRILAIVPPVSAFVALGFEHSIANLYFVPLALMVAASGGVADAGLTWSAFIWRNLVPVTLGNVLGGVVLVAGVYWFVYLRAQPSPD